jgi:hypothetical protein
MMLKGGSIVRHENDAEVRVRAKLRSRLGRLEARFRQEREPVTQIGPLKPLAADILGERHIIVMQRQPTDIPNWEVCEFEERPGPAPAGADEGTCRILLTEADMRL